MYFYSVNGFLKSEVMDNEASRYEKRQIRREYRRKTDNFNHVHRKEGYIFIKELSEDSITIAIASSKPLRSLQYSQKFVKALRIEADKLALEEITIDSYRDALREGDSADFIDRDKVEELLEIDTLREARYGEKILEEQSKDAIYGAVQKYFMKDSFEPELDRIYLSGGADKPQGHPVHYIFQTDDYDTRKYGNRALLQALYANGRINSKRYSYIDMNPNYILEERDYEPLYKFSEGGAVIIRYKACAGDEFGCDDNASGEADSIDNICSLIKRYRNKVLTIIDFPRECTRYKDLFFECLDSVSFVEIKEEFATGKKAEDFLKYLAKEAKVRTDKMLFQALSDKDSYLATDLRVIFDKWYDNKLKTSIYPEYREVIAVDTKDKKNMKAKGNAYDELQEMIGLGSVKRVIDQSVAYYKMQKVYKDRGMKENRLAMHMVFTGNPGTAKTTVARLFARIMKDNGILSKGQLVEVGRSDLVGKYVGWTADIVKKRFNQAKGGVLFIDEAYALVDDRGGSYGDEAINTIVQEMENHRDELIVIFAGYPDEMEKFLQRNLGLRSRIAFHIPFDNYSSAELCDIAKLIGKKQGVTIDEDAISKMESKFAVARLQDDFGNGRYVRNVVEQARMNQAIRLASEDLEHLSNDEIRIIKASDISDDEEKCVRKKTIGFVG